MNKTNLTYTLIHQVTIYPKGNITVRNPPLRVQDTCVTYIKPTTYFLIYSCPYQNGDKDNQNQGKIYVLLRSTFETIFEIAGAGKGARFGSDLNLMESEDGLQIQIFSIKQQPRYALSIVEIIYNPKLEPRKQYIDLSTISFETLFYLPSGVTISN